MSLLLSYYYSGIFMLQVKYAYRYCSLRILGGPGLRNISRFQNESRHQRFLFIAWHFSRFLARRNTFCLSHDISPGPWQDTTHFVHGEPLSPRDSRLSKKHCQRCSHCPRRLWYGIYQIVTLTVITNQMILYIVSSSGVSFSNIGSLHSLKICPL